MSVLLALLATAAAPVDYRADAAWLCRPGRSDACSSNVTVTIVATDGTMRPAPRPRPNKPAADCFYVYPTVSPDPGGNSDMVAGREERGMTEAQFARFCSVCRTFAPLYRQVTLTALRAALGGGTIPGDFALAYDDVRAAWRDYLARDNRGRPFVLIGHSQGSLLLKRLIAEEVDGKAVARRMLSAILPGTAVLVPAGRDVGGDFAHVPLCRSSVQTGCVVTWASYRDASPPRTDALFGRGKDGMTAGCTNPAKLEGGHAHLDPVLGAPWWQGGVAQYRAPAAWRTVPTRFVAMPGLLSGHCTTAGTVTFLAVTVAPVASPLAAAVVGAEAIGDTAYPDWGFHVVDIAIVQGDLIKLVASQTRTYRAKR